MTTHDLRRELIRHIDLMYLAKTIAERDYSKFLVFANASYRDELKRARTRAATETINLEEMVVKRMAELRAKPIMN